MIFRDQQVLARLAAIEQRLAQLESEVRVAGDAQGLRAELAAKTRELDALSRQGLRVAELLAEARAELARRASDAR